MDRPVARGCGARDGQGEGGQVGRRERNPRETPMRGDTAPERAPPGHRLTSPESLSELPFLRPVSRARHLPVWTPEGPAFKLGLCDRPPSLQVACPL